MLIEKFHLPVRRSGAQDENAGDFSELNEMLKGLTELAERSPDSENISS